MAKAENQTLEKCLPNMPKTLTERERTVIIKRFGCGMTLGEIAKEHCVTRERIRQIESKALRKLKCMRAC